jgi:minimal PKS acyl carrier protein
MPTNALTTRELAEVITRCAGVAVNASTLGSRPLTSFEDLEVDSLGVLGVVAELERRYDVTLGTEAEQCATPRELLAMVNEQLAQAA